MDEFNPTDDFDRSLPDDIINDCIWSTVSYQIRMVVVLRYYCTGALGGKGYGVRGTGYSILGTRYLVRDTWYVILGT